MKYFQCEYSIPLFWISVYFKSENKQNMWITYLDFLNFFFVNGIKKK